MQCSLCLWPQHAHQHQTSASQSLSGRMNHCIADLCTVLEACHLQIYRTVVKRFTHSIVHQEYCTLPWRCTTARRQWDIRFGCIFHPPLIQKDQKLDVATFSLSALMSLTIVKFTSLLCQCCLQPISTLPLTTQYHFCLFTLLVILDPCIQNTISSSLSPGKLQTHAVARCKVFQKSYITQ